MLIIFLEKKKKGKNLLFSFTFVFNLFIVNDKDWQDRYFYLELELERIATYFDILNEMHLAEDAMTKGLASS